MQQADRADSSRQPGLAPGNLSAFSGHKICLEIVDVNRDDPWPDHALRQIARVNTLLRIVDEAVEEASDRTGFWHRGSGWAEKRFDHISNVLGLISDEMARMQALMEAKSLV